MPSIFRKTSSIKLPRSDREAQHEEYWREHKGVTRCPQCGNVHFKKQWYSSEEDIRKQLKIKNVEIAEKKICPACKMIKEHTFEGELFIKEPPSRHRIELLRLINDYGEIARQIDPQDRIAKIEKARDGYRVTTTENQLAGKLAKKIKDAFNNVEVHLTHSPEPAEVDRIHVIFHGT
jgi:NMD protein affecting ribosome stability and mRNA decay